MGRARRSPQPATLLGLNLQSAYRACTACTSERRLALSLCYVGGYSNSSSAVI